MKPCPFCGSFQITASASEYGAKAHCDMCGASGPYVRVSGGCAPIDEPILKAEAMRQWNERAEEFAPLRAIK